MRTLLYGLNDEDTLLAIWKLLFSPPLRKHFGDKWSLEWSSNLIANFIDGGPAYKDRYDSLAKEVNAARSIRPKYSMASPPWSMVSLDMLIGFIPWVTPSFDRVLGALLTAGCALEKRFGEILPIAFFLRGGPGTSKETSFRICAPSQAVRASAEYWLIRAYVYRREELGHASLAPDDSHRIFSQHLYIDDRDGKKKSIFFETTDSFRREKEDFMEFLRDLD
ncbi:MAG TPA: hypothetical protein VKZ53_30265 [Candidatus Angelobacter sp.]|nr:hypothetical protein [Candidatus Angelobacter sp.]